MYPFMIFISIVIFTATVIVYVRHQACALYHPLTVYLAFHAIVFIFRRSCPGSTVST